MKQCGEFVARDKDNVYRRDDKIVFAATFIGQLRKPTTEESINNHPRKDLRFFITTSGGEQTIGSMYSKKGSSQYSVRTDLDGKELAFTIFTSLTDKTVEPYQNGFNYLVNYSYL